MGITEVEEEAMEATAEMIAGAVVVTPETAIVVPEATVVTVVVTDAGPGVTPGTEETPGKRGATQEEDQDPRVGADPANCYLKEDRENWFLFFSIIVIPILKKVLF